MKATATKTTVYDCQLTEEEVDYLLSITQNSTTGPDYNTLEGAIREHIWATLNTAKVQS